MTDTSHVETPTTIELKGRTIQVTKCMGHGQFGSVHQGILGLKTIAIKFLKASYRGTDAETCFKKEIEILSRCKHTNIITYFGSGLENKYNGRLFHVCEYAGDRTLRQLLEPHLHKDLTMEEKVEIIIQIMEGVTYLHKNNIMHHDLKPDNFFVTDFGHTKIGDFGLSSTSRMKGYRNGKGTIQYCPPECFDNQMGFSSDIWSLGVIFYELFTRELPFNGRNEEDLIRHIRYAPPDEFPERVRIDERWKQLIFNAMLVKDATQRFKASAVLEQAKMIRGNDFHDLNSPLGATRRVSRRSIRLSSSNYLTTSTHSHVQSSPNISKTTGRKSGGGRTKSKKLKQSAANRSRSTITTTRNNDTTAPPIVPPLRVQDMSGASISPSLIPVVETASSSNAFRCASMGRSHSISSQHLNDRKEVDNIFKKSPQRFVSTEKSPYMASLPGSGFIPNGNPHRFSGSTGGGNNSGGGKSPHRMMKRTRRSQSPSTPKHEPTATTTPIHVTSPQPLQHKPCKSFSSIDVHSAEIRSDSITHNTTIGQVLGIDHGSSKRYQTDNTVEIPSSSNSSSQQQQLILHPYFNEEVKTPPPILFPRIHHTNQFSNDASGCGSNESSSTESGQNSHRGNGVDFLRKLVSTAEHRTKHSHSR